MDIGARIVGNNLGQCRRLFGKAEADLLLEAFGVLANDIERVHDGTGDPDRGLFTDRGKDAADGQQATNATDELLRAAAHTDLLARDIDIAVAVKVARQDAGDKLLVGMVDRGADELVEGARAAELQQRCSERSRLDVRILGSLVVIHGHGPVVEYSQSTNALFDHRVDLGNLNRVAVQRSIGQVNAHQPAKVLRQEEIAEDREGLGALGHTDRDRNALAHLEVRALDLGNTVRSALQEGVTQRRRGLATRLGGHAD